MILENALKNAKKGLMENRQNNNINSEGSIFCIK